MSYHRHDENGELHSVSAQAQLFEKSISLLKTEEETRFECMIYDNPDGRLETTLHRDGNEIPNFLRMFTRLTEFVGISVLLD